MSRDLRIYSKTEYVYAISPTFLAMILDKGGRDVARSKPLSIIFTILIHCFNTTEVRNYSPRAECRCFRLDAMSKGPVPLSPLDVFSWGKTRSVPFARTVSPEMSFYLSRYGLVLTTPRVRKMSWGAVELRGELGALDYLPAHV